MAMRLLQYADIDLGVAVAIEDGTADTRSIFAPRKINPLREISVAGKGFGPIARAQANEAEEFQGGTFTVSNLGGMGSTVFPPSSIRRRVHSRDRQIAKVPVLDDCDQIVVDIVCR